MNGMTAFMPKGGKKVIRVKAGDLEDGVKEAHGFLLHRGGIAM